MFNENSSYTKRAVSANPDAQSLVTLDQLSVGESGVVRKLCCDSVELRNKLLVMGVVDGTPITIDRVAPLGDPISIRILGFTLSLRRSEAKHIFVDRS
jgi:Fe2+ transport system protein FeoA